MRALAGFLIFVFVLVAALMPAGAATGAAASTAPPGDSKKGAGEGGSASSPAPDHTHAHGTAPADADLLPPDLHPPPVAWFTSGRGLYVPKYYDTFKDLDLSGLSGAAREQFLHRVNTEFCTCGQRGCRRDTIANCYTNDTSCPRAPVRIRQILESVKKSQPPPPGSGK